MADAIDPEWELIALRRERSELRREVERLESLLSVARAELSCARRERDRARKLALQLADWGGYRQSGCADEATLAELKELSK